MMRYVTQSRMAEDQRHCPCQAPSFDLKLEKMLALDEDLRQDVEAVNQQLRTLLASCVKIFEDAVALQRDVSDVVDCHTGLQNARFEVQQMTSAVRSLLDTSDVVELPRNFNKVGTLEPWLPRGFEWDGVLFSSAPDTIWLVEATSAVSDNTTGRIKAMPERMARTAEFLELIYSRELPRPLSDGPLALKQLCNAWKVFDQMPKVINGVVAALEFTPEQLSAAAERNIKCVTTMAL